MIAIILIAVGTLFGFAYGVLSYALPFVPDMDVFTSTGIGFALGAGTSVILIIARMALALIQLAFALLMLLSPLAFWIVALVTDPLGRKARMRQRARLNAIYPPPDQSPRRHYAQT